MLSDREKLEEIWRTVEEEFDWQRVREIVQQVSPPGTVFFDLKESARALALDLIADPERTQTTMVRGSTTVAVASDSRVASIAIEVRAFVIEVRLVLAMIVVTGEEEANVFRVRSFGTLDKGI